MRWWNGWEWYMRRPPRMLLGMGLVWNFCRTLWREHTQHGAFPSTFPRALSSTFYMRWWNGWEWYMRRPPRMLLGMGLVWNFCRTLWREHTQHGAFPSTFPRALSSTFPRALS